MRQTPVFSMKETLHVAGSDGIVHKATFDKGLFCLNRGLDNFDTVAPTQPITCLRCLDLETHEGMYRCRKCKSSKIQGTLPAWFRVNEPLDNDPVDFDSDANYQYGYCEDCEESDDFSVVAMNIS